MTHIFISALGLLAAFLTALSYIPQVRKSFPRGSTDELSLKMLIALTTGLVLWVIYGLLIGDLRSWRPVIHHDLTSRALRAGHHNLKPRKDLPAAGTPRPRTRSSRPCAEPGVIMIGPAGVGTFTLAPRVISQGATGSWR